MEQLQNITQIKYEKTSCYFCNEWLENDSFKNHMVQCGQVLERCSNDCNAFVQRKMMNAHLKECPRQQKVAVDNHYDSANSNETSLDERLLMLETDISALRSAINEETRQRHRLITDVGTLRKHNAITDDWTKKVGDVLAAVKKCINEETDHRCASLQLCRDDVTRLFEQIQQLDDWRMEMKMEMDKIENGLIHLDNVRSHVEVLIKDNRISATKIRNLEKDQKTLKLSKINENQSMSADAEILGQFQVIDGIFAEHYKLITSSSKENLLVLDKIKSDLEQIMTMNSDQHSNKISTLDFEIKSMKHIVTDTEDKCDKLEQFVTQTKHTVYQTKQDLADLEVHMANQKIISSIQNTRGHLIWKIADYSTKLKDAKENDVAIRSPMFCNKQYGYTLRLDVNLNGIGTWKGRNLIACVTVVPGEWDPLLVWPCKLQADIILRDQPDDLSQAKDVSKTIVTKRINDKMEQNQYIYIPHKTITNASNTYLRNDAIFFEVRIHRNA